MIAKDFAQQLFNLQDRVAFVTGAGSGIGQMIAYGLASAGARVVGFDLREDGGLAETVRHIEAIGGEACFYTGDVRQLSDLRAGVALAKSRFGRLDIAVNAAGIANANPALEKLGPFKADTLPVDSLGMYRAKAQMIFDRAGYR